jgi:hypothetical protein
MPLIIEELSPRTGETVATTLFENGAISFGPTSHRDPPSDPIALLRARRAFFEAAEKVEVHDFERFRADCIEQSELNKRFTNLPGITQRAVELLVAGQQRINHFRQQLADIDAQLAATGRVQGGAEASGHAGAAEAGTAANYRSRT